MNARIDKQVFEKLFRSYYSLLCNYANKYVDNSQVVEDIVQNFFIAVWENQNLSVTSESFLPYAYLSIKNACINYYKSEAVKKAFFISLAEEWQESLEQEDDFIYKKEIRLALGKLPEKCRNVFLLKCVKSLKYKEIAIVCNISVNTVKYHIGEAFRILKEELKNLNY